MVAPSRRSPAFLIAFALANAGGVIGYLPLLTLLLPIKVAQVAGGERIGVLTATIVAGAVVASAANILFGWLSDRSLANGGGRRRWIIGGIVATALSYTLVAVAGTPPAIVVAIVLFQAAINAALAPLLAIMADEIPDAQKGIAGGLLALGNPTAALVSALLVDAAGLGERERLALVIGAMTVAIVPLLLLRAVPLPPTAPAPARSRNVGRLPQRDLAIASVARLLVQVAGSALSLYLLYYFETITRGETQRSLASFIGVLLTISFVVPLPAAVLLGRLSDRLASRKPFLVAAAAIATTGLAIMALAEAKIAGAIGFGIYAIGSAVFLALHAGYAMQLLPDPRRRGRDLGLLNLTNTLPALLGPLLTWTLATPHDFTALLVVLAILTLGGGLAVLPVRARP